MVSLKEWRCGCCCRPLVWGEDEDEDEEDDHYDGSLQIRSTTNIEREGKKGKEKKTDNKQDSQHQERVD